MKKILMFCVLLALSFTNVHAETKGATCPVCGKQTMIVKTESTGWYEYENTECIHGYSHGYDTMFRNQTSVYKYCYSCGETIPVSTTDDWNRVCHGY